MTQEASTNRRADNLVKENIDLGITDRDWNISPEYINTVAKIKSLCFLILGLRDKIYDISKCSQKKQITMYVVKIWLDLSDVLFVFIKFYKIIDFLLVNSFLA